MDPAGDGASGLRTLEPSGRDGAKAPRQLARFISKATRRAGFRPHGDAAFLTITSRTRRWPDMPARALHTNKEPICGIATYALARSCGEG